MEIIREVSKGETKEPKKEKTKEEKNKEEKSKKEKTKDKKESSKSSKSKTPKGEEKDIYFIITYKLKKKEPLEKLAFSKECESKPDIILNKEIQTNNNKYAYKKVFKYKNIGAKKSTKLVFYYGEELDKYMISLDIKEKTFIYDVEFLKGHKYLSNIVPEIIEQNIKYQDKLDLFLEALKENKEENKIQELYEETIELYSKKSRFSFLISLFSKIYEDKIFCESLLEKFYTMNVVLKGNEKKEASTNADRDDNLGDQFNSIMTKIESESDNLITDKGYNPIRFYGVILSYFNYYDFNTFESCFNKINKDNPKKLYEILLVYYSQFFKPIKREEDDKEFFINFFEYIISEKDFSYFTIGLKFILNIDTFIYVIDKTKEKIYEKYIKDDKNKSSFVSIKLDDKLELKKEMIDEISKGIKSIYDYSKDKQELLVYFKSDFWKSLLKAFEKPEPKCFQVCKDLRIIFLEYSKIIKSICDNEKDKKIIKDIEDFLKNDDFAYHLNEKLKIFFKNNKGKTNKEILGYIQEYNPYYQEEQYKYKRDAYILDDLNFQYDLYNTDEDYIKEHDLFIKTFQKLEYEDIFKDNMVKFLELMVNKIKDISSFDTTMDLIRINKIGEKVSEYIQKLKNKFELLIKPELDNLAKDKLKRPVEIIAKFEKLIFEKEKNINFLRDNINKLKIHSSIYNELMKLCKEDEYKDMKDFIFKQYLNNIKNIGNIIILIDSLGQRDKENFLKELMKKCKFTKNEFYQSEENNRIDLLCALYENKKLEKISGDIETTLNYIIEDLEHEEINKKTLQEFFENKEEVIKKRLGLIKLKMGNFEPQNAYDKLQKTLNNIKSDIIALSNIKKSLSIFQRETFREQIRQMVEFINKLETIKIKDYNNDKIMDPIKKLKEEFSKKAKDVDLVQDFLLFKVIYDNAKGKNQDIRFKKANEKMDEIKKSFVEENKTIDEIYENNKVIFDDIKKKLVNNEQRATQFFTTFEVFLFGENKENKESEKNKKLMDDLTLFFNGKKYELDLKGIFYFFNCLNKEDEWYKNLAKNYEKLSEKKLEELKQNLEQLKKEGIYEHEKKNNYSKLFTSLYEKKEAIVFLSKKIGEDTNKFIDELSDRIDPNSPTLTVQKICDTAKCIEVFKQFQTKKDNKEIFEYIKTLNPEQINAFESFSKVFQSIIFLDRNENSALNIFDQVDKIIKNAKFLFLQETEIFSYGEDNKITMDELIHLKNKINIIPKKTKKKK